MFSFWYDIIFRESYKCNTGIGKTEVASFSFNGGALWGPNYQDPNYYKIPNVYSEVGDICWQNFHIKTQVEFGKKYKGVVNKPKYRISMRLNNFKEFKRTGVIEQSTRTGIEEEFT